MSRWSLTLDPNRLSPYVDARMRQPVPRDIPVVPHSIPVVAFGNPETSRIATLGINPSRAEFLDRQGGLLAGPAQRFETLLSLAAGSLDQAAAAAIAAAVESCYRYFERRPYLRWFARLDVMLRALGASYWEGSACHLDLVQWATDPTWRDLPTATKKRAIQVDGQFLLQQLREHPPELLLLNGRTVVDTYMRVIGDLEQRPRPVSVDGVSSMIFRGQSNATKVIGWSANLQSSWGLTSAFRKALIARVTEETA